jgi:glycerophosphoryl diester phosphodiesterase
MILDWWKFIDIKPWPAGALKLPRLQCHRGYWIKGAQENTIEALVLAREKGAMMTEFDVQISRDQQPVLFHDETVDRFLLSGVSDKKDRLDVGSNQELLKFQGRLVKDLTAAELKECVNAPTLESVFQLATTQNLPSNGHTSGHTSGHSSLDSDNTVNSSNLKSVPYLMNIELKTDSIGGTPLERKVSQLIVKYKMQSRVLISSFNPFSLHRMSLFLPNVPRALLVTNEENPKNNRALRELWLAPFLSFHMVNFDQRMVDEEFAKRLNKFHIPFSVWTVNQMDAANDYFRWGAQSIISDTLIDHIEKI